MTGRMDHLGQMEQLGLRGGRVILGIGATMARREQQARPERPAQTEVPASKVRWERQARPGRVALAAEAERPE